MAVAGPGRSRLGFEKPEEVVLEIEKPEEGRLGEVASREKGPRIAIPGTKKPREKVQMAGRLEKEVLEIERLEEKALGAEKPKKKAPRSWSAC